MTWVPPPPLRLSITYQQWYWLTSICSSPPRIIFLKPASVKNTASVRKIGAFPSTMVRMVRKLIKETLQNILQMRLMKMSYFITKLLNWTLKFNYFFLSSNSWVKNLLQMHFDSVTMVPSALSNIQSIKAICHHMECFNWRARSLSLKPQPQSDLRNIVSEGFKNPSHGARPLGGYLPHPPLMH